MTNGTADWGVLLGSFLSTTEQWGPTKRGLWGGVGSSISNDWARLIARTQRALELASRRILFPDGEFATKVRDFLQFLDSLVTPPADGELRSQFEFHHRQLSAKLDQLGSSPQAFSDPLEIAAGAELKKIQQWEQAMQVLASNLGMREEINRKSGRRYLQSSVVAFFFALAWLIVTAPIRYGDLRALDMTVALVGTSLLFLVGMILMSIAKARFHLEEVSAHWRTIATSLPAVLHVGKLEDSMPLLHDVFKSATQLHTTGFVADEIKMPWVVELAKRVAEYLRSKK